MPDLQGFKCVGFEIKYENVTDFALGGMVVDQKPVVELSWFEHPDGRTLSRTKNLVYGDEQWGTEKRPNA